MGLELPILPRRGVAATHTVAYVRDLTDADRAAMSELRMRAPYSPIQQIRQKHHFAARLLAQGLSYVEVSQITGYAPRHMQVMQDQDPAFQELVAYYKDQVNARYFDVHERNAQLEATVTEELQQRLDNKPDKFTVGELTNLKKVLVDSHPQNAVPAASGGVAVNISFVQPSPPTIDHE